MEKEIISADYKRYKIIADIFSARLTPQVFCMHGAGSSEKIAFGPMRKLLAEKNVSSCALDFLGHGEIGGNMYDSSLEARTEQAELIIEKAKVLKPLTIIAGSMGCYNAIKLAEIYPVKLLVLSAPAVYGRDAYKINFSEKFSSFIRNEIIQKIYNSAILASHREIINFPISPHNIIKKYLNEYPEELKMVVDKIISLGNLEI